MAGPSASPSAGPSAASLILLRAAPYVIAGYATIAFLYWLARWFETGQQHLAGPVGAALVLAALPALDRLGDEMARMVLKDREPDVAARFHRVLCGSWRVLTGLGAAALMVSLWGVDVLQFVKGAEAPGWASAAFDIAVALLIGQLIWRLIQAALYQERHVAGGDIEDAEDALSGPTRVTTLIPMLRIFLLIVLSIVVLMIVLSSLGVSIGPLLASAGIVGIAIGFGAQTLVRDIFSGMFFLIDDAFRVGEYIELDPEMLGEIEAISIRSLQLRHHRGAVITVPFGEMKSVTNYSRDWAIYKMPFRLEPETDPAQVKKIVKRIGLEMLEDPDHGWKFLEPVKSQGVFQIDDDSALIMRVKFKCLPRMQFVLRREVYHRLRTAFDEAGIKFARKKVEVVSSDPNAAAAAAAAEAAEPPMPGGGAAAAANAL
ncbi:MAG: mechanosensitive ion channel family protein [Pseudomonadota bacterium]